MSALNDLIVNHDDLCNAYYEIGEAARSELVQLRAKATELQAARDEAGAIDGVPLADLIREQQDAHDFCIDERDRLRSTVATLTTIGAEQARQLEQARELLSVWERSFSEAPPLPTTIKLVRAWIAANPAPKDNGHVHLSGNGKCILWIARAARSE